MNERGDHVEQGTQDYQAEAGDPQVPGNVKVDAKNLRCISDNLFAFMAGLNQFSPDGFTEDDAKLHIWVSSYSSSSNDFLFSLIFPSRV